MVSDNHSPLKGKEWLASNGARNVQDEPGHLLLKNNNNNTPKTNKQKNKEALSKIITVIYKLDGIVLISLNIVYIFVNSPFLKVLSNTCLCHIYYTKAPNYLTWRSGSKGEKLKHSSSIL